MDGPIAGREITGVELLLIAYNALPAASQEEAFQRLGELRAQKELDQGSVAARFLCSLQRAAEITGPDPSPADYKEAYRQLQETEDPIEPIGRVIRHYGSWRRAKEALALSATTTAIRIESRFRSRRLGKIWRYTEETLIETLTRCADDLRHAPLVGEFEHWRRCELELAVAEGNDWLHVPNPTAYRKRWGPTWPDVLARVFEPADIEARLEQP